MEKIFPHRGFRVMMNATTGKWEIVHDSGKPSILPMKVRGENVVVIDEQTRYLHILTCENPDGSFRPPSDDDLCSMWSRDMKNKKAAEFARELEEADARRDAAQEREIANREEDLAKEEARPLMVSGGVASKYVPGESLT